nr:MAG TPA: zinc-ribbon domain protein [Caudoviricetes sp.]
MKTRCPICNYELGMCQCLFAGNGHPNREKIREVVLDHLYLFTDEQIKHIQYLEKYWNTSYTDEEKEEIKRKLKEGRRYEK